MPVTACPECGLSAPVEATACPNCSHALANGTAPRAPGAAEKPPPPAELSGKVFHKTPPEMIEEARRTFNEEAFLEEVRQLERNGGGELKDFLHELEQEVERP